MRDHAELDPSEVLHRLGLTEEMVRAVIRARNQRRRELRSILQDRQKMVETLLQLKQGPTLKIVASIATVHGCGRIFIQQSNSRRVEPTLPSCSAVLTAQSGTRCHCSRPPDAIGRDTGLYPLSAG